MPSNLMISVGDFNGDGFDLIHSDAFIFCDINTHSECLVLAITEDMSLMLALSVTLKSGALSYNFQLM